MRARTERGTVGGRRAPRPSPSPGPPGPYRLRRTMRRDEPLLVRHRRRMWEDIGGRTVEELDRADEPYRHWLRCETAARRIIGFLAETETGEVLGSGLIWLQPAQPRPGRLARLSMPYILSMYTEPKARKRRVASRIARALVEWATDHGYRRIFLHASHEGRSVYAALGFEDGNEMRLELPAKLPPLR